MKSYKTFLTETTDDVTSSANFKKWFGDSKVVDKDGKPLVVYHGTNHSFDKFDKKKIGSGTDYGIYGHGFYFSGLFGTAKNYGRRVISAYLYCKNPIYLTKFDSIEELAEHLNISEDILTPKDRSEYPWESGRFFSVKNQFQRTFSVAVQNKGYDGIVVDHQEIIVFEPEQIWILEASGSSLKESLNDIVDVSDDVRFNPKKTARENLTDIPDELFDEYESGMYEAFETYIANVRGFVADALKDFGYVIYAEDGSNQSMSVYWEIRKPDDDGMDDPDFQIRFSDHDDRHDDNPIIRRLQLWWGDSEEEIKKKISRFLGVNEKTETIEVRHQFRRPSTVEYIINPTKNEFWAFHESVAKRYSYVYIIRGLVSADSIVFWNAEFANHDDVAASLGFTDDVYYNLVVKRDGSLEVFVPYESDDTKQEMMRWIAGSKLIQKLFDKSRKIEYIGWSEDAEET